MQLNGDAIGGNQHYRDLRWSCDLLCIQKEKSKDICMPTLRAFVTNRPSAWAVRVEMIENGRVVFADNETIFARPGDMERVRKPLIRGCFELDFTYITVDGPTALFAGDESDMKRAILRFVASGSPRFELVAEWDIASAPSFQDIEAVLQSSEDVGKSVLELNERLATRRA